jgi:DinB family protein
MDEVNQLAIRFKEVLINGKWVANTNYKDLLATVSWEQATHKIGSLNTIAALTCHINYYIVGILNVFEGRPLEIRDKYSFTFQNIRSIEDWQTFLNELMTNSEKFAHHIEQMSDVELEQTFVSEKYGSYRRNIEGVIEHCYYHLGQISLIKKMILETE